MANHQDAASGLGDATERFGIRDVRGHGLLDENMFAGLECGAGQLEVAGRGRRYDHRLDRRVRDGRRGVLSHADLGEALGHRLATPCIQIDDPGHLAATAVVEVGDQVRAPVPSSDDCDTDHRTPAPLLYSSRSLRRQPVTA